MTPGVEMAAKKVLRPKMGSARKASLSSEVACVALTRSTSGAAPVTVICSEIAPTSSVKSSTAVCCVPMRNPCSLLGLESRERHAHRIRAGQHAGHDVLADFVRHRRALAVRVFVDERHFGAGDHALNVFHDPAQRALVGLCSCDCRAREQECWSAGHTPLRLVHAHKGNSIRLICALTDYVQALGASPVPRMSPQRPTINFQRIQAELRTLVALRVRRHASITNIRVRVGRVERTKMKLPPIDAANHRQSCS